MITQAVGLAESAGFIAPTRVGAITNLEVNTTNTGFSQIVTQGLASVNQQLIGSQQDLQSLAVGNVENLHQVMIRLEESKINFQLMMQVRNRLLEAYQDVIKMSV